MFLSLIPRLEREAYKTHVYLYSYFPDIDKSDPRPFVFRETDDYLITISRVPPNCRHLDIKPRIEAGSTHAFSLICSPQRGRTTRVDGKRVTLDRVPYTDFKEISQWLERRLEGAATVSYSRVSKIPALAVRSKAKQFKIPRSLIKGAIQITDRAEFIERATTGIGPKGWLGCGMLLMPDIMRDAMELSHAAA